MGPGSCTNFDSDYYPNLLQNKGLFQSDAALLTEEQSEDIAKELVDQDKFFTEFAQSMKRMRAIDVLTDSAGEIRNKCSGEIKEENSYGERFRYTFKLPLFQFDRWLCVIRKGG